MKIIENKFTFAISTISIGAIAYWGYKIYLDYIDQESKENTKFDVKSEDRSVSYEEFKVYMQELIQGVNETFQQFVSLRQKIYQLKKQQAPNLSEEQLIEIVRNQIEPDLLQSIKIKRNEILKKHVISIKQNQDCLTQFAQDPFVDQILSQVQTGITNTIFGISPQSLDPIIIEKINSDKLLEITLKLLNVVLKNIAKQKQQDENEYMSDLSQQQNEQLEQNDQELIYAEEGLNCYSESAKNILVKLDQKYAHEFPEYNKKIQLLNDSFYEIAEKLQNQNQQYDENEIKIIFQQKINQL